MSLIKLPSEALEARTYLEVQYEEKDAVKSFMKFIFRGYSQNRF